MAIDFQLQIYLLGGIFGIIVILLIFVLAALCGKLERFEMKAREQQREWDKWVNFSYENYAFNCPTIQHGEELNRRGFTMYPNESFKGIRSIRSGTNILETGSRANISGERNSTSLNISGTRDASSDFSTVLNVKANVATTEHETRTET